MQASRADFLTQSIINSKRGYRALLQDRLSARALIRGAAWHHNINSTIKCLGLDVSGDIRSCTEVLHRYDLLTNSERDMRSLRWENDAREQLALDLALSSDVFSDQPFSTFSDGNSELEAMTKTLSLASESPGVDFGYFRPVLKNSAGHYYTSMEEDEAVSFNGVQALLKNWVIGRDPSVRDGIPLTESSTLPLADDTARNAKILEATSSQRPPVVVASTVAPSDQVEGLERGYRMHSQASGVPGRRFVLERQPSDPEGVYSSQEHMTSTQTVPGPHGGRASLGKKKIGKKRLGGF
jgi:RNA polymerase I-specific transcription-initiation factor